MVAMPRIALALCAILLASAAAGASPQFSSVDDIANWMTYYYRKPEPARVVEAITAASQKGLLAPDKAAPPIMGFIAGVIRKHPDGAADMVGKLATLPTAHQPVLVLAVWYSGHPNTRQLLTNLKQKMPAQSERIDKALEGKPQLLTDIPLEQGAWVLDALWGNFLATGDDAPVVRIISALEWMNSKDVPKLRVGTNARWSLGGNAIQHPRVLEICKAQVLRQPQMVKQALVEVIAQAEEQLKAVPAQPAR